MKYKISNPGGDVDNIKIEYDDVINGDILITTSRKKVVRNLKKTGITKDKLDKNVYFKKIGSSTLITIREVSSDLLQLLITKESHINDKLSKSVPPEILKIITVGIQMANRKTLGDLLKIEV